MKAVISMFTESFFAHDAYTLKLSNYGSYRRVTEARTPCIGSMVW